VLGNNLTPPLTAVAAAPNRPLLVTDQGGVWSFAGGGQDAWRQVLGGASNAVPSTPAEQPGVRPGTPRRDCRGGDSRGDSPRGRGGRGQSARGGSGGLRSRSSISCCPPNAAGAPNRPPSGPGATHCAERLGTPRGSCSPAGSWPCSPRAATPATLARPSSATRSAAAATSPRRWPAPPPRAGRGAVRPARPRVATCPRRPARRPRGPAAATAWPGSPAPSRHPSRDPSRHPSPPSGSRRVLALAAAPGLGRSRRRGARRQPRGGPSRTPRSCYRRRDRA
jgi:hypothetical protein